MAQSMRIFSLMLSATGVLTKAPAAGKALNNQVKMKYQMGACQFLSPNAPGKILAL